MTRPSFETSALCVLSMTARSIRTVMHVLNVNLLSKVTVHSFGKLTVVQMFSNITCG